MQRVLKILIIAAAFIFAAASSSYAFPDYFHSKAVMSSNITPFVKWTGMLARYAHDREVFQDECDNHKLDCEMVEWMNFLEELRGQSDTKILRAVNAKMNKIPYVLDIVNWGMEDYWETPLEFFIKYGDCEDYAISKFLSLRLLGFSNDRMRLVVLQDLNLGIPHAILVVENNGKSYALDNFFAEPVLTSKIHHYQPIYSINEVAWWRHR